MNQPRSEFLHVNIADAKAKAVIKTCQKDKHDHRVQTRCAENANITQYHQSEPAQKNPPPAVLVGKSREDEQRDDPADEVHAAEQAQLERRSAGHVQSLNPIVEGSWTVPVNLVFEMIAVIAPVFRSAGSPGGIVRRADLPTLVLRLKFIKRNGKVVPEARRNAKNKDGQVRTLILPKAANFLKYGVILYVIFLITGQMLFCSCRNRSQLIKSFF